MIYLDTNIYLDIIRNIEPRFFKNSKKLLEKIDGRKLSALTSVLTIHEIKWVMYKNKEELKAEDAIRIIESLHNHALFPLTLEMVKLGTNLQILYKLNSHDAFHLATAILTKCQSFITRDKQLQKIKELEVLTPEGFLEKIEKERNK